MCSSLYLKLSPCNKFSVINNRKTPTNLPWRTANSRRRQNLPSYCRFFRLTRCYDWMAVRRNKHFHDFWGVFCCSSCNCVEWTLTYEKDHRILFLVKKTSWRVAQHVIFFSEIFIIYITKIYTFENKEIVKSKNVIKWWELFDTATFQFVIFCLILQVKNNYSYIHSYGNLLFRVYQNITNKFLEYRIMYHWKKQIN